MSASSYPGLRHAKPRPRALDQADKCRERDRIDRREIAKVRRRSGGRCEVKTWMISTSGANSAAWEQRCHRTVVGEPHHLIGGRGRRNVGLSMFAEHRIAVCFDCHRQITDHVLEPSGEDATTVTFTRRK